MTNRTEVERRDDARGHAPRRCGAKAAKPAGWLLPRYPVCNRPAGHRDEHREYDPRTANVRHEWWEPLETGRRR